MTVGTTSNFNLTRDEIVENAFRKIRVLNPSQQLAAVHLASGIEALNLIVRSWQAQGLHVWTRNTGVLFLDDGQYEYTLPTDQACDFSDFVKTTLSADEAAAQTVLSLTSTTGMTAADVIGIELDDGTRQWTTIVSVDSSTQVTVTAALTGAAASGNTVYTYTTALGKLYRIDDDVRRRTTDTIDNQVFLIPKSSYNLISDKTSTGTVNQLYHQPNRDTSTINVWPAPDNCTDVILFTYERDLLDFDTANDLPDFPPEWTRVMTWALAAELGQEYGIPLERQQYIESKAATLLDEIKGWDNDVYSIQIHPDCE
jgi:hypothetical protein